MMPTSRPRSIRFRSLGTQVPALLAMLAVAAPVPLAAQSLLASSGLGFRAEPLDARTRGLGNPGVGLAGWRLLSTDPSAAAGLTAPSITATLQPSSATLSDGRSAGHARFPTVGVTYPYGENVISVQYASFLDQEWEVLHESTISVGGILVPTRDQFTSTGSVGQVQLAWARRLAERVALGVNVGTYVGAVERILVRQLDPETVGPDVEPFVTRGRWRVSGNTASAGLTWDPSSLVRLSGAMTWSDDLALEPVAGAIFEGGSYAIPMEFRVGGMATLASGLTLAFGVTYADWSKTGQDLGSGETRGATWTYGSGLEWTRATLRNRTMPIRVGIRHVDLPFHFGGEASSERVYSGGLGLYLVEIENQPIARIELGLERGERSSGALSEEFWRTTLSVRLAGS